MIYEEKFMQRCLELAQSGLGKVAPNPMVGCVIVHNGFIIGEGYHNVFGGPHAEVNAIKNVANKELLSDSTLYVNLEPCSHYGKTPPCADLIISHQIPRIVIGTPDPFEKVAGKGIEKLLQAGCSVFSGVLTKECRELNKRFFTYIEKKRPYIILKWAQTADGFIDILPDKKTVTSPTWITGEKARILVHKWRSEEQAILTGKNTVIRDNPSLTTRFWYGKNPLRVIITNTLPDISAFHVFDNSTPTLVFSNQKPEDLSQTEFIQFPSQCDSLSYVIKTLYDKGIQSLIIEGGAAIFESFIAAGLWDEARIFTGSQTFAQGVKAPEIKGKEYKTEFIDSDILRIIYN